MEVTTRLHNHNLASMPCQAQGQMELCKGHTDQAQTALRKARQDQVQAELKYLASRDGSKVLQAGLTKQPSQFTPPHHTITL